MISLLVSLLPEAAVAPILIFIGLEITAQAFVASPSATRPRWPSHFIPAVAALVLIQGRHSPGRCGQGSGPTSWARPGSPGDGLARPRQRVHRDTRCSGGVAVVSHPWSAVLAAAAAVFGTASLAALVGVIHSPLPSGALFWPGAAGTGTALRVAGAYGLAGAVLLFLAAYRGLAGSAGARLAAEDLGASGGCWRTQNSSTPSSFARARSTASMRATSA